MNRPKRQSGLAIVEFALSVPVLFMILLATAELVNALNQYAELAHAVRQSVRYVAGRAETGSTGTIQVGSAQWTQLVQEGKNLVVYGVPTAVGSPRLPQLATTHVFVEAVGGVNVRVRTAYPYRSLLGGSISTMGFGPNIDTTFNMTVSTTIPALTL